jgi:hypothetical protein
LQARLIPGSIAHSDFRPFAPGAAFAIAQAIETELQAAAFGANAADSCQQKHMFMDGH